MCTPRASSKFFGAHAIAPGTRVETRLGVHRHLVRQRLLPDDVHTPERKDAVVQALLDPAKFTAEVALATMRLDNPDPAYQSLIGALNARRVTDALRARLAAHNHYLSGPAAIRVRSRDSAWLIRDAMVHAGERHVVQYDVAQTVAGGQATLVSSATLVDAHSAREFFPIQLFFFESENELWHGKLFELAGHAEHPAAPARDRERFDAVRAALDLLRLDGPDIDLRAVFAAQGRPLSLDASLRVLSTSGTGATARVTWVLGGRERFRIRLEHPATRDGTIAHRLSVYLDLDPEPRIQREHELAAVVGQDPDSPGPELAATLDRLTTDELIDIIDHLRSPYRAAHSIYIHHAQQALRRKHSYFAWWQSLYREAMLTEPLVRHPYAELDPIERDDKRALAYDFAFNDVWQEVKASHPALGTFTIDRFAEEDLWAKLGRTEDLSVRVAGPELDPSSPYTDLDELRAQQTAGLEPYYSTDKTMLEAPDDAEPSCADFAAAIARWKELQATATDSAEIERLLGLHVTADGKTFADHAKWLYGMFKLGKMLPDLKNLTFMTDGIAVKIVSKIPYLGVPSALGVPTVATILLRAAPALTIPLTIWMKQLAEEEVANQIWEAVGKVTAIRQWLRRAQDLTFATPFPERLEIDLGWAGSASPHIERYFQEQREEYGRYSPFVFAPDRMKKGFDEGVALMATVGPALVDQAAAAVTEVLRELQLDACKVKVLVDARFLDLAAMRAQVVRALTRSLLDKVRGV